MYGCRWRFFDFDEHWTEPICLYIYKIWDFYPLQVRSKISTPTHNTKPTSISAFCLQTTSTFTTTQVRSSSCCLCLHRLVINWTSQVSQLMVRPKNLYLVWVLIFGFVVGFESFDILIWSKFWFLVWILGECFGFDFGFRSLFLSLYRWKLTTASTGTATDIVGEPFLRRSGGLGF